MRYHYKKPDIYLSMYGKLYICNHPVYDRCTLFTIGDKGLAVIQQRFNPDRIMYLGMSYIERGYITQDEYENLKVYLFEPYEKLGGNGSAKRIMQEVDKLPIHKFIQNKEDEHDEHDET